MKAIYWILGIVAAVIGYGVFLVQKRKPHIEILNVNWTNKTGRFEAVAGKNFVSSEIGSLSGGGGNGYAIDSMWVNGGKTYRIVIKAKDVLIKQTDIDFEAQKVTSKTIAADPTSIFDIIFKG